MKSEERSVIWKCSQCDKEFKYESEKRRHEQSHDPQFECKVCSKKFSFQSALRRHEKQHDRKGYEHCDKCGGKFRDETLLKRHMQYAHKGTYSCIKCSATFSSEIALRTHMKTHKPKSERKYQCSYADCEKTFNFAHHLKHHEFTHTNAKQYYCKECGKGFIQASHLKIHQRIHNPESWISCTVANCHKQFANKYALKRHLATHKNKAPMSNVKQEELSVEDCEENICQPHDQQEYERPSTYHKDAKEYTSPSLSPTQTNTDELDTNSDDSLDNYKAVIDEAKIDIDTYELGTNDCKSVLGGCIVTGSSEIDSSCLCAQMSDAPSSYQDLVPSNVPSNNIKADIIVEIDLKIKPHQPLDLKCIDKIRKDKNACDDCDCASICGIRERSQEISLYETPAFTFKDGVVKIKDTFDVHLNVSNDSLFNKFSDIEQKVSIVPKEYKSSAISSCRDVLGNCIAGGGEGCLCARMTADNQQMMEQEIQEITPCPKETWLL